MKEFRKFGRIMKFQERMVRADSEMAIWRIFRNMGETYKTLLKKMKPDIVKKLEQLTLEANHKVRACSEKANKAVTVISDPKGSNSSYS